MMQMQIMLNFNHVVIQPEKSLPCIHGFAKKNLFGSWQTTILDEYFVYNTLQKKMIDKK
jgi:hypothetical protein